MSLENIYANQVRGKSSGGSLLFSPNSLIERDPTILNLEKSIREKINQISPPETPAKTTEKIKTFSVEDAIKELIEMNKKPSN
ncbi:hypothetical protein EBU94_00950 [bacterium]|nr:hypothetical protein [bacterium]NBO36062.1 hypothetical protein [bacterium]